MSVTKTMLSIDVSDVAGEAAAVTGFRYPPSPDAPSDGLLFVCLPGGTYTHGYFDLEVPGHPGYSFAGYLATRGHTVVAFDNLGTGASSRPGREVGLDLQAAATARALDVLAESSPRSQPMVGVGHSMGGYVAIFQQAEFQSYDALAILGTTNQAVSILDLPADLIATAGQGSEQRQHLVETLLRGFPVPYLDGAREALLSSFHLHDVAGAVMEAERTTETVVPRLAAAQSTVPGIARDAAARIDVPLFLGFGATDVSPSPHNEPSMYPSSGDITLFVLPGSAHCHNMATSRKTLWDRLEVWATLTMAAL